MPAARMPRFQPSPKLEGLARAPFVEKEKVAEGCSISVIFCVSIRNGNRLRSSINILKTPGYFHRFSLRRAGVEEWEGFMSKMVLSRCAENASRGIPDPKEPKGSREVFICEH